MSEDKAAHTQEQQTKPRRLRPWRPTRRQVLWAVGTLVALMVTIALLVALLVVNLDAVKWENLSRERIAQVALFIGIAVAATTLIVLLAIGGASLGWTGFRGKTVWDLLQILIVPLALAVIGLWFAAQQEYLNQMGSLLLGNGLRKSEEGSEERTLARARTLTVLGRLDTSHKTP